MTKITPGRSTTAEDEMIQDILDAPIEEIRAELREAGLDSEMVVSDLRSRLARAQDEVIQRRLAAARMQAPKRKAHGQPAHPLPKTINGGYSVEGLTMAARNGKHPLGFSDPTVQDDLAELDSEDWDED